MDEKFLETEAIQTLRKHFELSIDKQAFDLYVPPQGEPSEQVEKIDVLGQVDRFIHHSNTLSLLILGDSGLGKSTFAKYLTQTMWNSYGQAHHWLPLFIYLPLIPEKKRKSQLLGSFFKLQGLNETHRGLLEHQCSLLLILDGYDEIPEAGNLWLQNGWPIENIKVITFCRQEALSNLRPDGKHYEQFYPPLNNHVAEHKAYSEIELQPFNEQQINHYLANYNRATTSPQISAVDLNWQAYHQQINEINGLKELIRIPFILSLVMKVLPDLLKELNVAQNREEHFLLTRTKLYDYFVKCWFAYQAERIIAQKELPPQLVGLADILLVYAQNLARHSLKNSKLLVVMKEKETLEISLLYPYPKDSRDEQYYQLVNSLSEHQLKLIRSGCLLTTDGNHFRFLHKSLLEYLTARDLFEDMMGSLTFFLQDNLKNIEAFNERSLVEEPAILHILADKVKEEPKFKERLFEIIEYSKKSSYVETAAANAITILNYANVPLLNKNFHGVRIPGADLSYALLKGTDFSQANLENVKFHQAYLEDVNFYKAYLKDASFGQKPIIHLEENFDIYKFFYSHNGDELIIVGDTNIVTESLISTFIFYDVNSGKINRKTYLVDIILDHIGIYFDKIFLICVHSPQNIFAAVTLSDDRLIQLWDMKKETCIQKFKGHNKRITCINFSANGKLLGSGSLDKKVRIWDMTKQTCFAVLTGHSGEIYAIAFSSDGQWLVSGGADTIIRIWDVAKQSCFAILTGHSSKIYTVAFSPSNQWLASGSADTTIRFWDIEKQSCFIVFTEHSGEVQKIIFSPNGQWLASVGKLENAVRLWDIRKFNYATSLRLQPSKRIFDDLHSLTPIVFSPNGLWLITASGQNIQSWNLEQEIEKIKFGIKNTTRVWDAAFSKDGKFVVILTGRNIKVWDIKENKCVAKLNANKSIRRIILSQNASWLAGFYAFDDNQILLWNIKKDLQIQFTIHRVCSLHFNSNGDQFATGNDYGEICLWNTETQTKIIEPVKLKNSMPYFERIYTDLALCQVCLSSNSKLLASGQNSNSMTIWSIPQGICLAKLKIFTKKSEQHFFVFIRSLFFSPNNKILAARFSDGKNGKIYLWDVKNLQDKNIKNLAKFKLEHIQPYYQLDLIDCFKEEKQISLSSFSSDSKMLAISNNGGRLVYLCKLQQPAQTFILDSPANELVNLHFMFEKQLLVVDNLCQFYIWQLPSNPDEKPYLISVPRGGWPLVCQGLNIEKAIGLAEEKPNTKSKPIFGSKLNAPKKFDASKIELLQQLGAIGKPILSQEVTNNSTTVEDILLNTQSAHAVVAITNQFSLATRLPAPPLSLTYDQWVISLLRVPKHKTLSSHRFLVLEGFTDLGKLFFLEMHFYQDINNLHYGTIIITSYLEKDSSKSRQEIFDELLINFNKKGDESLDAVPYFESNNWSITRNQGRQMIQEVKNDQTKKISYLLIANTSFFTSPKQAPTEATVHNCFSWAREKLLHLNDPNIYIPSKLYLDYIAEAAIPNSSLPEQEEAQQNNSPCLIL